MLIIYGMVTWVQIMNIEEDEDALATELYAQQWSNWKSVLGDANARI